MANDLTIVLPLYGRAHYTRTWLKNNLADYYDYIVADGSSDDSNAEIFGSLAPSGLQYCRYPADASVAQYAEKICDAVGRIRTKYTMMCDNDDLLLTTGIRQCIAALELDPGSACAGGPIAGACGWRGQTERFSYPMVVHNPAHLNATSGLEAVRRNKSDYRYFWYSIFRTESYQRIWNEIRDIGFSNFYLVEMFHSDPAVLSGYHHVRQRHYLRLLNPLSSTSREISAKSGRHTEQVFFDERYRTDLMSMSRRLGELLDCPTDTILEMQKDYFLSSFRLKPRPGLLARVLGGLTRRLPVFTAAQVRAIAAWQA